MEGKESERERERGGRGEQRLSRWYVALPPHRSSYEYGYGYGYIMYSAVHAEESVYPFALLSSNQQQAAYQAN
jgi:hypothetical protein